MRTTHRRIDALPLPRLTAAIMLALAATLLLAPASRAETVVKAIMYSDLRIVDPIWSTVRITRNHGYMIYDTLFAIDEAGEVRPQMVGSYAVSADKLAYTLTLRDGLLWHDGAEVTAEDCIASIRRWAAKDALGRMIAGSIASITARNVASFEIRLTEPTPLLLFALGKSASSPAFMMPRRVAETDPGTQISDLTGSGPFVFQRAEWRPGDKAVYTRFDQYKPRDEAPSGLAGGKVANVNRVEWLAVADPQQQVNALRKGEVDYVEMPLVDLLPLLKQDENVKLVNYNPLGFALAFRFNSQTKPFDAPAVRQAAWRALNQEAFLQAAIGDPAYYRTCKSFLVCGTDLETDVGMRGLLDSNFAASREILQRAGYDGSPVVLLQWTGLADNVGPLARELLERGGFRVDMQSMEMQALVARTARKDPSDAGGWSAYLTGLPASDIMNPALNYLLNASCDKAPPGWPCDAELERLRANFLHAPDAVTRRAVAMAAQERAIEVSPYVPLGQFVVPLAARKTLAGIIAAPVPVFWNLTKN